MPGPKFTIDAIAKRYADVDAAVRTGKLNLPRALASYAHVVKNNGLALTNLDSAQADEVDDDAGSVPFVISTYQEDRDGDVVVPAGCRLENFSKNPVCFFGHQEWPVPIGRCKSPDGRVTVWPEDDQIRAVIYFDRADPDADLIYGKVKRGYLNATSIAFVPLKAVRREDVEKARTRNQPMAPPGWLFQEYDLTEVSVVGVPSNQDAIREMLDNEKSFISPRLQKALRPYAAKARGRCFSGWCSGPGCEVEKAAGEIGLWKYNRTTGYWVLARMCAEDQAQQWLQRFQNDEPKESFKLSRNKPSGSPAKGDPVVAAKKKPAPAKKVAPAKKSCSCGDCRAGRACGCAKGKRKSVQADIEGPGQQPGGRTGNKPVVRLCGKILDGEKDIHCSLLPGHTGPHKKALESTSGTFGGYTIEPGKVENQDDPTPALTDTATDGYVRCESCFESPGNCADCDGKGSITSEDGEGVDCLTCKGSGECVDCGGVGQVPKPEGSGTPEKSVRKAGERFQAVQDGGKWKVIDLNSGNAVGPYPNEQAARTAAATANVDGRLAPYKSVKRKQAPPTASAVHPASPASSPPPAMAMDDPQTALAKLYGHAKAEVDYLDGLPDEQKATLAEYRDEVGNRMETIKAAFGEQFPGDDFDKCLAKAMESDGSSDTMEPGEAGEVESGRIPPETKPMQKDKPNYDAGEHSCDMCGGTGKINYAGNDTKPCTACGGTGVIKPGRGRTKPKGATMARRKTQQKEQAVPGTATVMQGDDDVAGELDSGAAPYNKDSSGTGDSVDGGDAPYNDASAPQEKAEPFAGEETPEEEDLEDAIQGKDSTGIGDPVNPPGDQSYNKNGDGMAASPCPGCGAPGTGKPFCADCGSPADGGASKDSTGAGDPVIAPGNQAYNKNGLPPGADDAMPPDQVTADSQTGGMVGDPAEGSAPPDTDADTQEILERYRQPKSLVWQTRKWEVHRALLPYLKTRTTKSGDVYLVKKGDNPFAPDDDDEKKSDVTPSQGEIIVGSGTVKGMLARVTEVKDHLAAVYKAGDIPAHHKAGFKHGWTQLGYVGKALTDMGKFQANGGKGSPLSNAGHVQANDGGGSKLDDKGEVQANRKSAVRQVSPAVEQRLNNFLRFAQQNGISVN